VVRYLKRADRRWPTEDLVQERKRWDALMGRDARRILEWYGCTGQRPVRPFVRWLRGLERREAVGLTSPGTTEAADAAMKTWLPVMAWPRVGCLGDHDSVAAPASCPGAAFRQWFSREIAGVRMADLPRTVKALRATGDPDADGDLGQLTLYWEDPYRHVPDEPLGVAE
jgi:hypothetical protein